MGEDDQVFIIIIPTKKGKERNFWLKKSKGLKFRERRLIDRLIKIRGVWLGFC